ncbi:DUF1045 domain-containing protein [Paracoccus sediminicola]|uniref:DUF1045 domain-containing protein n=1 Tax=Paracoccus sediminicola TaxID=3017783 RepID=UPI0022F07DC9|nr:DUF1045 domain-containing protein [Paracoccus sediminicola]WBU55680.1 DUF1045 domain-containing protein [Paracoccus sediminicola]
MNEYRRYALYYTPPEGALADFGAGWLGWDIASGRAVAQPVAAVPELDAITATPRKYGFHATLKPPFRLAAGAAAEAVLRAARDLARSLSPAEADGLRLDRIGPFLALVAGGDNTALNRLAAATVTRLDHLRAPLTEAEFSRRAPGRLSPRQRELLDRWGYPYVLDEFRFHMTLTGALGEAQLSRVEAALTKILPPMPQPFTIDAISLVGEGADGRFRLIERLPL